MSTSITFQIFNANNVDTIVFEPSVLFLAVAWGIGHMVQGNCALFGINHE